MKFFSPLLVLAVAFVALTNPVLAEEDEVQFFDYAEASASGSGNSDVTTGSASGSGTTNSTGGINAGDVSGSGSNSTGEAGKKSAAPSSFAWGATATLVATAVAAAVL